jgi:hypothetical protein
MFDLDRKRHADLTADGGGEVRVVVHGQILMTCGICIVYACQGGGLE